MRAPGHSRSSASAFAQHLKATSARGFVPQMTLFSYYSRAQVLLWEKILTRLT